MKVQVSNIPEGENPFHFESKKDAWLKELAQNVESKGYKIEDPFAVDLKLTKLEPDYYMRGKLDFKIGQTCARCAEDFVMPMKTNFELALVHVPEGKAADPVLSEESEELDVTYFEGPALELAPIVEEQLVLSLPVQATCKPNCLGICQTCGQNLNVNKCDCDNSKGLSPFADLLKNFKP